MLNYTACHTVFGKNVVRWCALNYVTPTDGIMESDIVQPEREETH